MPQVDQRPAPEAVHLRAEPFPDNGLLPLNYRQRLNNEQLKERDLSDEKYRRRKAAAEGGPVYASPTCTKSLTLSLFFDGTNNHEPSDREAKPLNTSNLARLPHAVFATETHGRTWTTPTKPAPCFSLCFRANQLVPFPLTARKELTMSEFVTWRSSQASLALLAFAVLLPAQAMGNKPSTEMVPAGVEGYNHTSAAINRFSVNRAGGPNIGPYQGGGKQSCCASLPRQWRPGLMATVEWEKDPNPNSPIKRDKNGQILPSEAIRIRSEFTQHRAVVEIPRYEKSCGLNVHFLPCDQVKVVSYCGGYYGDPGYPVQEPLKMKEPKTCPK
ncbi:DUF3304 domain-containing protein [Chromobacterium rhizoryzae]|uniref:DUF3304 domain-containing protein n=1 Tax=Chromobacterium rhizoryzae TaxID=1778675 RepID=UPI001D0638A4|nr:DUF3304 domain-containing protein [Chromobacterium rhizoryzae]